MEHALRACGSIFSVLEMNIIVFYSRFRSNLFSELPPAFGSAGFAVGFELATAHKPFSSPLGAVPLSLCMA